MNGLLFGSSFLVFSSLPSNLPRKVRLLIAAVPLAGIYSYATIDSVRMALFYAAGLALAALVYPAFSLLRAHHDPGLRRRQATNLACENERRGGQRRPFSIRCACYEVASDGWLGLPWY